MINSAIGTRENIRIIDSAEHGKMKVEVMEYQKLLGSTDTRAVMDMYFMEKQNIRARQVAVYLNNESVTLEPGAKRISLWIKACFTVPRRGLM